MPPSAGESGLRACNLRASLPLRGARALKLGCSVSDTGFVVNPARACDAYGIRCHTPCTINALYSETLKSALSARALPFAALERVRREDAGGNPGRHSPIEPTRAGTSPALYFFSPGCKFIPNQFGERVCFLICDRSAERWARRSRAAIREFRRPSI